MLLRHSKLNKSGSSWQNLKPLKPVTILFFYLGSYKVGNFILGNSVPFDPKYESFSELAKLGVDATIVMLVGGVILGIVPGIAAYFITRKISTTLRARRVEKHLFDEMP